MRYKAHVLIAAILVLVFAAVVTVQLTEIKRKTVPERLSPSRLETEIEQLRVEAELLGDAVAQFSLGLMYATGNGVPRDYQEAIKWYRLAAEQGYSGGQYNLGLMYYQGKGVAQDYQEAVKWVRFAAEQGEATSQLNLGVMYDKGEGVAQDYVQAHKWFNLATSRVTTGKMDDFRLARDKQAERMTDSQVAEAQRLAREWQLKTWEQLKGE